MTAHAPEANLIETSFLDTRFTVPSIRCAGCISKIETGLAEVDGINSARVNFSTKRVAIRHLPCLKEHQLISALRQLGFEAQPVVENPLGDDHAETRQLLRALAVAGFAMMNIMLLSISVWSGAEGSTREMFHWISGLIALPTIAYSGRPFFSSALMALRYRRTNMDVPISIGVLLATALSVYETVTGGEHAYFESAVMLLFFLLAGRALDATMRETWLPMGFRTRVVEVFPILRELVVDDLGDLEALTVHISHLRKVADRYSGIARESEALTALQSFHEELISFES